MHLGGVFSHFFDFRAAQFERHGSQAAQFGFSVFVNYLGQRQYAKGAMGKRLSGRPQLESCTSLTNAR